MQFDHLLSRLNEEDLGHLIGAPTIKVLRLLDPDVITMQYLRDVLLRLNSPEELLADPSSRNMLLASLKRDAALELAGALKIPHSAADVYAGLKHIRIRRGSSAERVLYKFFELKPPIQETRTDNPTHTDITGKFPLFRHQRLAARNVQQALTEDPHRVVLHMPTGSGKTRTAMHIIADHLRAREPGLVIWLAYSEELCEQATSEFSSAWSIMGNRDVTITRFWGNHALDLDRTHDGIIIASLTKLYRAGVNNWTVFGTLAGRCTLVVIDEAHQAVARTFRDVLNTLKTLGRSAAILGLTATPGRTWNDVNADEELSDFFGRRKVGLEIEGYVNPVEYLIDEGYLARVEFCSLPYGGNLDITESELQKIASDLEIPASVLKRLAENDQRNLILVAETEKLLKRHRRIILFAASVDHARMLSAVLSARGHDAAAVTSDTPSFERNRILLHYKDISSEPRIVCNFGVLTTGFDAPQTSAALIARPTKSLVLYSQMVGRATRGTKVGGNSHAEIVTIVDKDLPGFGDMAEAFSNWEDVWRDE